MPTNEEYENDILNSPFLEDRSKNTYIRTMRRMLKESQNKSIHSLLHDPDKYGPMLEKTASTEEVYRTYMVTVLAFLKYSELKQTNHELFTKWYKYFKMARKVINRRLVNHEATDRQKEAHVPWETVLECYKKSGQGAQGSQGYLLISLITLMPPRRQTDWYRVRIYNNPDKTWKPEDFTQNYINLNYKEPYILLSDYKTFKFYGRWYKKLPAKLLSILRESIKTSPREWLFQNNTTGEPYELEAFTKWSNRVLKRVTGNEKTSMKAMRHAFVTYIRKKYPNMTLQDQLIISKDMGHSIVQNMGYKLN